MMERMNFNEGVVMVRIIPGDGHCLFASLVNQYHDYDINDDQHREEISCLRRLIVNHIRNNDQRYQPCLVQTIIEEGWNRDGAIDQAVEEFLYRLEHGREWGGEESIAAASEILRCRIDVYHEEGPVIKYNKAAGANKTLRIAYRLPRNNHLRKSNASRTRDHYDSVDHILNFRAMVDNNYGDRHRNLYTPPMPELEAWQQNAIPNDPQISQRTIPLSMDQATSQNVVGD